VIVHGPKPESRPRPGAAAPAPHYPVQNAIIGRADKAIYAHSTGGVLLKYLDIPEVIDRLIKDLRCLAA
jgi:hypothetical protein